MSAAPALRAVFAARKWSAEELAATRNLSAKVLTDAGVDPELAGRLADELADARFTLTAQLADLAPAAHRLAAADRAFVEALETLAERSPDKS